MRGVSFSVLPAMHQRGRAQKAVAVPKAQPVEHRRAEARRAQDGLVDLRAHQAALRQTRAH